MPLNLLPESATKQRGEHDDELSRAVAMDCIAILNELQMAIDSGTSASLLGWLRKAALDGDKLSAKEMIEPLRKIYDRIACAQSHLITIWLPKEAPETKPQA